MLPGFVTSYKDKDNYIHLYFYPGYNNNEAIYEDIKINNESIAYDKEQYDDGAIDILFKDKNIIRFSCSLVNRKTKKENKIIITC